MTSTWDRVRVIVEVPVRGKFSENDLVWAVRRAMSHDGFWQDRKYLPKAQQPVFGQVLVKSFTKVIASTRKELLR